MSLFNKKRNNQPKRREPDFNIQVSNSNTFKRNRTLTGTTSNNINSINTDTNLESTRKYKHKLTTQRRKMFSALIFIIITIMAILVMFSNFTASLSISVSDITISKPIKNKTYESVIQDYFDANPISRFSFFQDQSSLSSYVSSQLPEVLEVKHRSTFAGRTNFNIKMRSPVAGWNINNRQYYVDSQGVPFETNYYTSPSVQIIDNSGVTLQKGSGAVASRRFLTFVGRVVYLSKVSRYTVTQAIMPVNTTRELDIKLKETSYYIKLSIDRPAGEQVEDMTRSIQYLKSNGRQNPQYIDLRVSGKASYRL